MVALAVNGAFADTPASQVYTQTVQPAQTYPEVPAKGEGWFDVGGFCKVVDVGDLSALSPPASGIPVFVPGPADQWENYRTSAPSSAAYGGKLALTTCCRPQSDIAMLCTEAGAVQVAVSREYGKVGEVDTVTATCVDQWGKPYQDQVNVTCSGDNGPDGQAQWVQGSDTTSGCTPNAFTSACTASCGGGTQTTWDSCGNVQAITACNTQACCTPSYSYECDGPEYIRTDNACGTGSNVVGSCTLRTSNVNVRCNMNSFGDCIPNGCGGTVCYTDCDSWPDTSAYDSCSPNQCSSEAFKGACPPDSIGHTCAIVSQTCTSTRYVHSQ